MNRINLFLNDKEIIEQIAKDPVGRRKQRSDREAL